MEYINLSAYDLCAAIRERNAIERARLEFEKQVFEFNKQLSIDNTKANTDMANTIASLADNFNQVRQAIETLSNNDACLKKEIDALNFSVANLQ